MEKISISVIMPAFNEEENVRDAVKSIDSYLHKKFSVYEIIIVDDGSTDATANIVRKLKYHNAHIRLVSLGANMGYGGALRAGFSAARYLLIFYTDADLQFDISDLDKLLPLIANTDIVIGYRVNRQDPLMRIFIAVVYNFLICMLFGLKVKDVDCSFKLYRRIIFTRMQLKANTGLIDAEVLLKALKQGFRLQEIAVTHYPRRHGRTMYEVGGRNAIFAFIRPQVVLDIFKEINSLWSELR